MTDHKRIDVEFMATPVVRSDGLTADDFRVFFAVGGVLTLADWRGMTPAERGAAVSARLSGDDRESPQESPEDRALQTARKVITEVEAIPGIVSHA